MQWLLMAVVLGAACWMVSALTYQQDESAASGQSRLFEGSRDSIPRLAAGARATLARWLELTRSALLRFGRTVGPPLTATSGAVATATAGAAGVTVRTLSVIGSWLWTILRAVAVTLGSGARAVARTSGHAWNATTAGIAERRRARAESRARLETARQHPVSFEKSLILTGPQEAAVNGVALPALTAPARRPSALTRLLVFIQLVFLVVLWGSGAALAIAGAAWAVTRIV